jgi:hypothetical protein
MSDTLVPTLTTDLLDYAPNSTATIAASGFVYSGLITFEAQIFAADGTLVDDVVWTVSDDALSDPTFSGSLTTTLPILANYANTTIQLTATETTAGADGVAGTQDDVTTVASTVFTDSVGEQDLRTAGTTFTDGAGAVYTAGVSIGSGTGIFGSFLVIDSNTGQEEGFNTDFRGPQAPLDDNNSLKHTHSLQLSSLAVVNGGFYEFVLDVNQPHTAASVDLSLDALKIYQANTGNLSTLSGLTPIYDLGANWIELSADLSKGSGHGADLSVLIPTSLFNPANGNFIYLYSHFGANDPTNGGFEEWRALTTGNGGGGTPSGAAVIDKQVTGDHAAAVDPSTATWFDIFDDLTAKPVILAKAVQGSGGTTSLVDLQNHVYFQTIVTNEALNSPAGSLLVNSLTDHQDTTASANPLDPFTFGALLNTTTTIADGGSATSNTKSSLVLAGSQQDTATLDGTETASGSTIGVTAQDSANYYGAVAAITLDKQISGNGSTWLDIGAFSGGGAATAKPVVLVGKSIYFQTIVTNATDGHLGVTGLTVSDHDDTNNAALANFTIAGALAADGGSATSTGSYSVTVLAGTQQDTAHAHGTVTDSFANSADVDAYDSANYYGATPAINVEKLVSVDGGVNWYFTADDADDTIANISSLTGIAAANLHIGTPTTLAGASVQFEVVVSNITDGGLGMTLVSVSDHEDTTIVNLGNFTLGTTTLAAAGSSGDHEVSSVLTLTALSGTQVDTATAGGTVTDSFGNTATPSDTDVASYNGLALATPGLTAGFWAQHTYAWDAYAGDNNSSLVTSHVLSSADVLSALPTGGVVPYGTSVVTNPLHVPSNVGVLLGDADASGTGNGGEVTLSLPWLSADLVVAGSTSTSSDARLILMQQAVAAQLNIDNHDADPGFLSANGGYDLLGTAVKWLTGKLAFSDGNAVSAAYNVDNGPINGVLDSGAGKTFELNTSNTTLDKGGSLDFVGTSTSDWGVVKVGTKFDGNFVVDSNLSALLGGKYVEATGQDLKNALQAFNQDQLVTSADGSLIGWNVGGVISDVQTNNQDGMWKVLTDHSIGHLVTTLV